MRKPEDIEHCILLLLKIVYERKIKHNVASKSFPNRPVAVPRLSSESLFGGPLMPYVR